MSSIHVELTAAFPQFRHAPLSEAWTEEDSEALARFMSDLDGSELQRHHDSGETHLRLGETAFTAWAVKPDDWNGRAIIIPGEFANGLKDVHLRNETVKEGLSAYMLRRALAVRALVDPNAAVAVLPNDTIYEENLGFTKAERQQLYERNGGPIVDRMRKLSDDIGAETIDVLGLSQGATTANLYAMRHDTQLDSLAVIEAPDIMERKTRELVKGFMGAGKHFPDSQALSSSQPDTGWRSIAGLVQYGAGILLANNRSFAPVMSQDNLSSAIDQAIRKQAGVMHVWAEKDNVSPFAENHAISLQYESVPSYEKLEIVGRFADHGITNLVPLCAAAVRRARSNQPLV